MKAKVVVVALLFPAFALLVGTYAHSEVSAATQPGNGEPAAKQSATPNAAAPQETQRRFGASRWAASTAKSDTSSASSRDTKRNTNGHSRGKGAFSRNPGNAECRGKRGSKHATEFGARHLGEDGTNRVTERKPVFERAAGREQGP